MTFTTPERDRVILKDRRLEEKIWLIKDRWVIGLHHNWHDYQFVYNPLFDFSMAGEEDLKEVNGQSFPLIPMDACNFVPEFFRPSQGEKFWDILYIARAVSFKGISEFFKCIRYLYDRGRRHRVLFICPMPAYDRKEKRTVLYDIRDIYDKMFSEEEEDLFTLLTLDFRYPFPFDLETLAYFYRSSKVFVHFADEERRCRVAAYAWATALPVVGMPCIGSLLPEPLRIPPYYYEVPDDSKFPEKIVCALDDAQSVQEKEFEEVRRNFSAAYTGRVLCERVEQLFTALGFAYQPGSFFLSNLDIRLGRHHGIGVGPNNVLTPLPHFLDILKKQGETAAAIAKSQDPERELESSVPVKSHASLFRSLFNRV